MFRTLLAALSLFCFATAVRADPYQVGDVFAVADFYRFQAVEELAPPDLSVVQLLNTGSLRNAGCTFDALGNLYVTNFDVGRVTKLDNSGALIGPFGSGYEGNPESILFDSSGNAFVGEADTDAIKKFDPSGQLLDTYRVDTELRGTDWIDLDEANQILYYTSEGARIFAYDIANRRQLPDFARESDSNFYALRLLPDGGLIAARTVGSDTNVARFNNSGQLIASYAAPDAMVFFSLTLDPDGTSFWVGDILTGYVHHFDLGGALLGAFSVYPASDFGVLSGLAVYAGSSGGARSPFGDRPQPIPVNSPEPRGRGAPLF
jgi:sugar lactone lactonase YvrE